MALMSCEVHLFSYIWWELFYFFLRYLSFTCVYWVGSGVMGLIFVLNVFRFTTSYFSGLLESRWSIKDQMG